MVYKNEKEIKTELILLLQQDTTDRTLGRTAQARRSSLFPKILVRSSLIDCQCWPSVSLALARQTRRIMNKKNKKLTPIQKRAKKKAKAERQKKYEWIFMNGKQVRVKRPPTIDGMSVDEFIQSNADPIWLHQNEMWEYMDQEENNDEDVF